MPFAKEQKERYGICWSAFYISINKKTGEKYCPGVFNLKAPIMTPMQFGMRYK